MFLLAFMSSLKSSVLFFFIKEKKIALRRLADASQRSGEQSLLVFLAASVFESVSGK